MTTPYSSIVYRLSVRSNNSGVVPAARLDRAFLRVVVHVHDAEAARVTMAPLEVVEQRPHVIPAQPHSLTHCFPCRIQMVAQVSDSQRIVNAPIDRHRRIVKRSPVLGYVQGNVAVTLLHPDEYTCESRCMHLPSGLCVHALDLGNRTGSHWQPFSIVLGDAARVIVDSEEVDRLSDGFHVVFRKLRPGFTEDLFHLVGISPEEHRIEILSVHVSISTICRGDVFIAIGGRILWLE